MRAGAIRAKPIALTALAAMIGAFFILDDPIFNGLAVSLIFGILVSTVLTLVVIPVLYLRLPAASARPFRPRGRGGSLRGIRHVTHRDRRRRRRRHSLRLRAAQEARQGASRHPGRRLAVLRVHAFESLDRRRLAQAASRRASRCTTPLEDKGIQWLPQPATPIDAPGNALTLANGQSLRYDYLVIATGPRLAFEEVPGLGPAGYTHSICTHAHSLSAWDAYQQFLKDPGPIVVGAVQGASCFGPAYEFAMILDADLRKRKLRDRVPMTFVTSEPYIGHMGLGGVGDSKGLMESELRQRHIKWITNARVERGDGRRDDRHASATTTASRSASTRCRSATR